VLNITFNLGEERQVPGLNRQVFWKCLQVATIATAFVAGSGAYSLRMHYAGTRPNTPDMTIGRTIPLNTHGTVIFLKTDEKQRLDALGFTMGLSVLSSVLIYVFRRPFGK
jgi:hypothetical protein